MPDVPGRDRGHPQAPDLVLDSGQGRDGRPHPDRARAPRPERDRRVPAGQPSARLPGVRQGRRVPAPGHHLRVGSGALALHRAQAAFRKAAGAVAAGRDRPRALHPLLPVRALLPGGRRGLPADLHRTGRRHVRGHPRRPPLRGPVQRQYRRALPGRGAHLAAVPVPRAAVGHRGRRRDLHAVPVPVQRRVHRPRREGDARARSRRDRRARRRRSGGPSGGRRRVAVRQGTLRLPGHPRRRADHPAARARRRQPAPGLLGAGPRGRRRPRSPQGRSRHAGRRAGHQRGGLPAPAVDARGA